MEFEKEEVVLDIGGTKLNVTMQNYLHSTLRASFAAAKYFKLNAFQNKKEPNDGKDMRVVSEHGKGEAHNRNSADSYTITRRIQHMGTVLEDCEGVVQMRSAACSYRVKRQVEDELTFTNYKNMSKPVCCHMERLPNIVEDEILCAECQDFALVKFSKREKVALLDGIATSLTQGEGRFKDNSCNTDRDEFLDSRNSCKKERRRNVISWLIERITKSNRIRPVERSEKFGLQLMGESINCSFSPTSIGQ